MAIKWNEYTWYSRTLAGIFFFLVLPILCFYLGMRYEQAIKEVDLSAQPAQVYSAYDLLDSNTDY